jgi:hypothetical protein
MSVTIASRISVAALAFFAVVSSWSATLAMPGLTA